MDIDGAPPCGSPRSCDGGPWSCRGDSKERDDLEAGGGAGQGGRGDSGERSHPKKPSAFPEPPAGDRRSQAALAPPCHPPPNSHPPRCDSEGLSLPQVHPAPGGWHCHARAGEEPFQVGQIEAERTHLKKQKVLFFLRVFGGEQAPPEPRGGERPPSVLPPPGRAGPGQVTHLPAPRLLGAWAKGQRWGP